MGCDIHIYLEQNIKDKWVCVDHFPSCNMKMFETRYFLTYDKAAPEFNYMRHRITNRNYKFFAALASVRGEGKIPKGFPDDASDYASYMHDEWEGDAHSASWMLADEFCSVFIEHVLSEQEVTSLVTERLEGSMDDLWRMLMDTYIYSVDVDDPKAYRFVFFFDN